MSTLLDEDIEHVLAGTTDLWESLRGRRLFITGGTGFFGCWLLETFVAANRRYQLGARAVVLSREPGAFARRVPELVVCPEIFWVRGSILELTAENVARQLGEPVAEPFEAIIHLVTEADTVATAEKPLGAIEIIAEGTRRALEFASAVKARRVLFTSSGAVYGRQPSELSHLRETFAGAPVYLDASATYAVAGEAKRYAELLCGAYARERGLGATIARCFAFVGPYLPLDSKFAIGNFLDDALNNREIIIKGDGTPTRSYLYAADLTIWLWTLLFRGQAGRAYNVGSERAVSIREAAEIVQAVFGRTDTIRVLQTPVNGRLPDGYIPSTQRIRGELGLTEQIGLEEAVKRTATWLRARAKR